MAQYGAVAPYIVALYANASPKYQSHYISSFTVDFEDKVISFYAVQDYSMKDRKRLMESFRKELEAIYPDMRIEIIDAIDM